VYATDVETTYGFLQPSQLVLLAITMFTPYDHLIRARIKGLLSDVMRFKKISAGKEELEAEFIGDQTRRVYCLNQALGLSRGGSTAPKSCCIRSE
jgi:hypothetical protein